MATSFDSVLSGLGIKRTDPAAKAIANATGKATLDQTDFLKLMTAQLKNQDPFEPVDNTQMVGQMAQFSSLASQQEMNSTLKAIADKLGATSASDALAWVGKTVQVEGDTAYPLEGGGFQAAIELDADATDVAVTIQDATGKVLSNVSMGAQKKGLVQFLWDGSTQDGSEAGPGPFTVTARAVNGTANIASRTLVWAPVTSVQLTNNGDPVLTVPGIGQVSASEVRNVG